MRRVFGGLIARMGSSAGREQFVGAIDQGTTSSRFLIFNREGEVVASAQQEFKQIYPQSGWHEHDPLEIVSSVQSCIDRAVLGFQKVGHNTKSIRAVGITNQRETTVVWHRETGEPLHNAIVWTDTRAQATVRQLKRRSGGETLQGKCGVPLTTYPSVSKLLWLLDNVPRVREAYDKGTLVFGTVDTWLVYKLNGGPERNVFVTDASNASRTMFMNLETLQYDKLLLNFFHLEAKKLHLAQIVPSADARAYGSLARTLLRGVPITACLGDQSAALVGQRGLEPGTAKNTYGTGCFLLYNVGSRPIASRHGLLTTVAFDFRGAASASVSQLQPHYALEGSIAAAGSSVKFLVNNLGLAASSGEVCRLAESVADSGGVVFVTAFSGLFAPYWCDDARGTLFGLTSATQRGHIARATIEATCFQTKAILDAMEADSGEKLAELAVDGGMTASDVTMQIQADLVGVPVRRPAMAETTALGAAIAAGLAIGVWNSLDEVKGLKTGKMRVFEPTIEAHVATERFGRWNHAVEMSKGWTT